MTPNNPNQKAAAMTTTAPPSIVTIDGLQYVPLEPANLAGWRIVIAQRGWVAEHHPHVMVSVMASLGEYAQTTYGNGNGDGNGDGDGDGDGDGYGNGDGDGDGNGNGNGNGDGDGNGNGT